MDISRLVIPTAAAGLLCLTSAPRPAAADTTAFGFTSDAIPNSGEDSAADFNAESYDLGYSFTANADITVTQLGWFFDPGFTSLAGVPAPDGPHAVGLFSDTGAELTSATVAYTGGGQGFAFAAPTSTVNLLAGDTYVLAGVTGADDPFLFDIYSPSQPNNIGLTENSAVSYGADRIDVGAATLAYPADTDGPLVDPAYFGPNFQFVPATSPAVPESSPLALLGLGLLPLGVLAARVRRRA